jgi:predicted NBD/HSP70 family sugar kinase
VKSLRAEDREITAIQGIGVVVPGMVERSTMQVLHAPTLGWRNVNIASRWPRPPASACR